MEYGVWYIYIYIYMGYTEYMENIGYMAIWDLWDVIASCIFVGRAIYSGITGT